MVIMSDLTYESLRAQLEAYATQLGAKGPNPTRDRIVSAGRELFTRQGFRKTSVDEIARQAQVAKGTIYTYFNSKTDLMMQAIVDEKMAFMQELEPVLCPGQTGRAMLRKWIGLIGRIANDMPLVSRLLSGDGELMALFAAMGPQIREQIATMQRSMLMQFIELAVGEGRLSPTQLAERAQVLLGLMYVAGQLTSDNLRGEISRERYAELLAEIIVEGLAPTCLDEKGQ